MYNVKSLLTNFNLKAFDANLAADASSPFKNFVRRVSETMKVRWGTFCFPSAPVFSTSTALHLGLSQSTRFVRMNRDIPSPLTVLSTPKTSSTDLGLVTFVLAASAF